VATDSLGVVLAWFGGATALIVGTGLVASVLLFPFALLGLPVWLLTGWVGSGLARLERARYALLLGERFDGQPMPARERNPLRYGGAMLRDTPEPGCAARRSPATPGTATSRWLSRSSRGTSRWPRTAATSTWVCRRGGPTGSTRSR
jgi:hypothetical protein